MIGDSLLTTPLIPAPEDGSRAQFLFGLVPTPEWLALGGDVRGALVRVKVPGTALVRRSILMQADLEATVTLGRVVGSVTAGYAPEGALGAAITRSTCKTTWSHANIGSATISTKTRRYFYGAGRMNLPFGIRSVEHIAVGSHAHRHQSGRPTAIRRSVRLDGRARCAANSWALPAIFSSARTRTASAATALTSRPRWLFTNLALGASSLITHRQLDPTSLKETWRQVRTARTRATRRRGSHLLALLTEWDYTLTSARDALWVKGIVGYAQAKTWKSRKGAISSLRARRKMSACAARHRLGVLGLLTRGSCSRIRTFASTVSTNPWARISAARRSTR